MPYFRGVLCAVVLASALLMAFFARAATVDYLFLAAVPVVDQSPDVRTAGIRTALEAVLIKVTGLGDAATSARTQPLFADAAGLVDQYRYVKRPGPDGLDKLYLAVQFDEPAVQRALRQQRVRIWGKERPQVLVVLAAKAVDQPFLVSAKGTETAVVQARNALKAAAARRGVPLLMPALDAFDEANFDFADIWRGSYTGLPAVAKRYAANLVLAGQALTKNGTVWQTRWTLLDNGQTVDTWLSPQGTLARVASSGVQDLTDRLVARFFAAPKVPLQAIAPSANGDLLVDVVGVDSLQAYAAVVKYLQGLSLVKQLNVVAVDGDRLRCGVQLQGSPRQLQQAIALDNRLIALPADTDTALLYRVNE